MKTLRLKALKPHKYGTRQLTADDEYDAPIREAVALIASRKAKPIKEPAPAKAGGEKRAAPAKPASAPPPRPEPAETPSSIDSLRQQASQLGIVVDGRWGAGRLQYEIDKVKG